MTYQTLVKLTDSKLKHEYNTEQNALQANCYEPYAVLLVIGTTDVQSVY